MADTDAVVRGTVGLPGVAITALAPNLRGAQAAYAAGAHRVSIPVSVSEGHSQRQFEPDTCAASGGSGPGG